MKKTTRILAVLMTVCLLFGVVCAFASSAKVASAKKESDLFVVGKADTTGTMATPAHRFWATFDNGVLGATPTTVSVTKGTETHTYTDAFARGGSNSQRFQISVSGASKSYPAGLFIDDTMGNGEGYLAIRKVPGSFRVTDSEGNLVDDFTFSNGKAISAFAPEYYFVLAHNASWSYFKPNAQHFDSLRYATVDFDYGTDRWAYQVDGVWETGITVPADADPESVRPANAAGSIALSLTEFNYASDSNWVKQKNNDHIRMTVAQDAATGNYFLSGSGKSWDKDTEYTDGEDMWLSNQPGVLDHFTVVLDITTENEQSTGNDIVTAVTAHIFVNGEHFTSKTLSLTTKNLGLHSVYFYAAQLGSRLEDNSLYKENDRYSMVVDNVVPNYYKKAIDAEKPGYQYFDSADGVYGLDDYLASADVYKNVNLSKCPDTLYGIYETRDDAIAIINGTKYKVVGNTVDLGNMIANESTALLPAGKKFVATPASSVETFNVTLGEGAKIELINVSYKFSELDADTNTYTATKIDTKASLTLLLKMNFNFYVPADTPFVDFFGLDVTGPVDVTVGGVDYKQFTWTPEIDSFETNTVTLYYDADKTLACTTVLDILKYASGVADEYACGSKESTLVYETMKYKLNVAAYADDDFDLSSLTAVNSFFDKYVAHAAGCTCKDTCKDGIPADTTSKGTLEGLRISYVLDISETAVIIEGTGATDALTVTYNNGTSDVTLSVGNGITRAVSGNSVYYIVDGITIESISSVLTVTNGTQSGTYSLYAHIQALTAAEKTDAASVASSLYAYSVAAKAYINSIAAN